ncbi:MAG: glycosyltransferase family 87 protein [Melioribacteraceae bacterium]
MTKYFLVNLFIKPPKYFSIILLIILGLFHFRYGIIPAWSNLNSDFPNYYTSSKLLLDGKDLSKIYDDKWFQQKINEYGIDEIGKFSPFPPPTVFVMIPEALFNPLTAKRIYLLLNIIVLFFTALLFRKVSNFGFIMSMNFILLSGTALINNFLLGQFYLILLFLITLGYYFIKSEKEIMSGTFWGIGAAIKYFPLIFIPALLIKKKSKTVVTLLLVIFLINLIALFFFGVDLYIEFINKVFFSHLNGELSSQSKYAVQFQSWNSLLLNIFVYDPIENPIPLINSPFLLSFVKVFIYLFFISLSSYAMIKIRNDKQFISKGISLSCIIVFVLSPASASYHLLLLSLPALLLIDISFLEKKHTYSLIFIALYVVTGFVSFAVNKTRIDSFGLFFLYYHLWLMVLFFFTTVWFLLSMEEKINEVNAPS